MNIAAYVCKKYAKETYTTECHDVRAWPGFEIVLDAIRRRGYDYEYAGAATVHEYDVVLISITSDCDWWPYLREMRTWRGRPLIIAGGAGVLNVRPFLPYVDCFVLGRGEDVLPAILDAHKAGNRDEGASVIWSDSFDMSHRYEIKQTDRPYPHQIALTNGKPYKEQSIGCPNKCAFCGYTWHRKYYGDGGFAAGAESMASGNREHTILDLLKMPPDRWQDSGPLRIVGLDGMSERLRYIANKRISREMFRTFLSGLATIPKPHQVKLYCIVGYPTETEADWQEFVEDLRIVDAGLERLDKQWSILLHVTPMRSMPATPSAIWPMSYRNYRGVVARTLKSPSMPGNVFYQGNRFWCVEGMGTDGLPTVIQSAICHRGTEDDSEMVMTLACSSRYWGANMAEKQKALEKTFDVTRYFREYTWEDLPTRYLRGYLPEKGMCILSDYRKR